MGFLFAAAVFSYCIRHYTSYPAYIKDRRNSGSVHEFLYQRLSRNGDATTATRVRLIASLVTVVCLLIALTLELTLTAQILAPVVHASPATLLVALAILIAAYGSLGGFWSVVWTDVLQGFLLTAAIAFLTIALLTWADLPVGELSTVYPANWASILYSPKWQGILAILTITAGWYLVTMDTWQRACATRDAGVTLAGLWKGTIVICLGLVCFVALGMYDVLAILPSLSVAGVSPGSGGLNPVADLYLASPLMPAAVQVSVGVFLVGLVMAGISTADTFLIVASHSLVSDLVVGIRRGATFGELSAEDAGHFAAIARLATLALGFGVILMYFLIAALGLTGNALNLFFVAYSIPFALLVPVVHAMRAQDPAPKKALWSMVVGFVVAAAWGFGFAIASARGYAGTSFATTDELLYLTPLVTICAGSAAFIVLRNRATGIVARSEAE